MSSKKIAFPTPKKGKWVVLVLLAVGLYCVITDPVGSSESVNGFLDSLGTFRANLSGGGR